MILPIVYVTVGMYLTDLSNPQNVQDDPFNLDPSLYEKYFPGTGDDTVYTFQNETGTSTFYTIYPRQKSRGNLAVKNIFPSTGLLKAQF